MATILLADDERIFRVVQGTLLRREACRLLKAPVDSLPSLAVEHEPDLVIVPASAGDEAPERAVRALRARAAAVPIIVLGIEGPGGSLERPVPGGGPPIEFIEAGLDPERLESILAAALEKYLDLEGRGTERIPADLPVRCTRGTTRFTARTKDISTSGLFLKLEADIHPGDRLDVSFRLPAGKRHGAADIDGECEVVRLISRDRDDPDLIPGAGLRFVRLSPAARADLERLAVTAGRPTRSEPGHVTI